jgi:hypothetical protein
MTVSLGMILLGGEVYVTFKPNLIDEHGDIGDDATRTFLQASSTGLQRLWGA